MASEYSTGPALVYAGVGPNFRPLFLGTSEGEPEFNWDTQMDPVMNDIGGKKPIDYQFMGEECLFSAVFSRFNWSVLRLMQAKTFRATAARGVQAFGSMGAFMAGEGHGFPLWVRFPYASKAALKAAGMPAGLRFPICFDQSERIPVGTKAQRVSLQIHAIRQLAIANGAFNWLLYDESMAAVANIGVN